MYFYLHFKSWSFFQITKIPFSILNKQTEYFIGLGQGQHCTFSITLSMFNYFISFYIFSKLPQYWRSYKGYFLKVGRMENSPEERLFWKYYWKRHHFYTYFFHSLLNFTHLSHFKIDALLVPKPWCIRSSFSLLPSCNSPGNSGNIQKEELMPYFFSLQNGDVFK